MIAITSRATGAGLLAAFPQIEQSGASHSRHFAVAALVCAAVRGLRTSQVTPLAEQPTEIERADGIAALLSASVGRLRTSQVTPLLEQPTEI